MQLLKLIFPINVDDNVDSYNKVFFSILFYVPKVFQIVRKTKTGGHETGQRRAKPKKYICLWLKGFNPFYERNESD